MQAHCSASSLALVEPLKQVGNGGDACEHEEKCYAVGENQPAEPRGAMRGNCVCQMAQTIQDESEDDPERCPIALLLFRQRIRWGLGCGRRVLTLADGGASTAVLRVAVLSRVLCGADVAYASLV